MSLFLNKPKETRRAAMIFAINYKGTDSALQGCINDGKRTLKHVEAYEHVEVFTDDTVQRPTRATILAGLERLAAMSRGDRPFTHFVIHYSGHGTWVKDTSGDEDDRRDEAWYAIDGKIVVDDEIRAVLNKFSPWATVMIIVDACHSGTSCDLPLTYAADDSVVEIEHATAPVCNVLMLSGCKDTQTSADIVATETVNGRLVETPAGAMTKAMYDAIDAPGGHDLTVFELRERMHRYMIDNNYDQRPQLTSSRPLAATSRISDFYLLAPAAAPKPAAAAKPPAAKPPAAKPPAAKPPATKPPATKPTAAKRVVTANPVPNAANLVPNAANPVPNAANSVPRFLPAGQAAPMASMASMTSTAAPSLQPAQTRAAPRAKKITGPAVRIFGRSM